jgi:hypothetical protein
MKTGRRIATTLASLLVIAPALAAPALAGEPPIKEIVAAYIGFEVNALTNGNLCTVASGDECQPGKQSGKADGFSSARGIAGAPNGNVYVADSSNHRVQEFTATGRFVLMWGKKVNKNGADICTSAEESQCQAGEESSEPGVFAEGVLALAVDPTSGDVYVSDKSFSSGLSGTRIQKFTSNGEFLSEIGREVNETTKGNFCTRQEELGKGVKCAGPKLYEPSAEPAEPGSFGVISSLAVGGPEDRLYVDEKRGLQEFDGEGQPVGEPARAISSRLVELHATEGASIVVDKSGDIFLSNFSNVIRRFDPSGKETEIRLNARTAGAEARADDLALDGHGRLAVLENESEGTAFRKQGTLYSIGTGRLTAVSDFSVPAGLQVNGMGINGSDELYLIATQPGHEAVAYEPVPIGELIAGGAPPCVAGADRETDATLVCRLEGQVDPWGVADTEVWFGWGATPALESDTPVQLVCGPVCGSSLGSVSPSAIQGLVPNEPYYYQLIGHDANVGAQESFNSEQVKFMTPSVPPRLVGESSTSFIHATSAVVFGEVNPENSGTVYAVQYGACPGGLEACANVDLSEPQFSSEYAPTAATFEIAGLQPSTVYRYRLVAVNEYEQVSAGPEATFTTAPAPLPEAQTGAASAVTSTSALISGSVDPDGASAVYTFELGIYKGAETRYGLVISAPAGEGAVPVTETLALSGLQPGTTYAYRIRVRSGYGQATGEVMTFTTEGLPAVLPLPTAPGLLQTPDIAFPASRHAVVRKAKRPKRSRKPSKRKARRRNKRKK